MWDGLIVTTCGQGMEVPFRERTFPTLCRKRCVENVTVILASGKRKVVVGDRAIGHRTTSCFIGKKIKRTSMGKLVDFAGPRRSRRQVNTILRGEAKKSVNKDTKKKYSVQRGVMKRFLKKRGWHTMTVSRFEDFLAGMVLQKRSGGTARTYRAAWMFWRELDGLRLPSSHQMRKISRVIKGMSYQAGAAPGLPRGALDSGMLKQLRFHCEVNGLRMYADGFALCFYGMLRHRQLVDLRRWDVRRGVRKGPLLALGKKKAFCADRCRWQDLSHFKAVPNCRSLLRDVCKSKRGRDKVFKDWDQHFARKLIQEAAKVFEWDTTVRWDGVHCFRHGAAQEWHVVKKDKVQSMMRRATWSACASAARYGKKRGVIKRRQ